MGIRSKIKSRLKEKLEQIRVLFAVVQDEANYPGRPQPHMAAKNPFWGGGEREVPEESKSDAAKSESSNQESFKDEEGSLNKEGADFWFLQYDDNEGWNETNPGEKE